MPKAQPEPDKTRLTDEECDFIIQRVLWKLREMVSPMEFFTATKRAVVLEVTDANRAKVRDLVRLFARING